MKFVKFLSILIVLIALVGLLPFAVLAEETTSEGSLFDTSDVMDDLAGCTVNGEPFAFNDYPLDNSGLSLCKFLTMIEYGYGTDNYNLYFYVYRPQHMDAWGNEFLWTDENDYLDHPYVVFYTDAEKTGSVKLPLTIVSESEDKRFTKLKLSDPSKVLDLLDDSGTRVYRMDYLYWFYYVYSNGIEADPLMQAERFFISSDYTFIGSDAGNDKSVSVLSEERIYLDLYDSVYRTQSSPKGDGWGYDIFTSYFSIPKEYFDRYERIQSIQCYWDEKETAPTLITNDYDFYNSDLKAITEYEFTDGEYNKNLPSMVTKPYSSTIGSGISYYYHRWGFNDPYVDSWFLYKYFDNYLSKVDNILYSEFESGYKYNATIITEDVSDVKKWVDIAEVEESFTIICDETFDIHSFTGENGKDGSFIKRLFNDLTNVDETEMTGVEMFRTVSTEDFWGYREDGDNSSIAKSLLINERDLAKFKSFFETENAKGNMVVQLRFAVRDYYSEWVEISGGNTEFGCSYGDYDKVENGQTTFLAISRAFFGFDVISMTFMNEGVLYKFAVNAKPIDIFPGFTTPVDGQPLGDYIAEKAKSWLPDFDFSLIKTVFMVICVIFAAILLVNVLTWITNVINTFRRKKE